MKSVKLFVVLGSVAVVAVLAALLIWTPGAQKPAAGQGTLVLYCAAGMKPPIADLVKQYEQELGVSVQTQYGGSGTLLGNLRVAPTGDLYLAADTSYIQLARAQGLIAETIPLATIRPVIAVPKGNPKGIQSAQDLLRADVHVALGNPDAASIGKQTEIALTKAGLWKDLEQAVQSRGVFKPTVNDIANDLKIATVDAGVIWDSTARQYPELQIAAPLTDDPNFVMAITVAVLRSCRQPTAALRFARYLAAPEKGAKAFQRYYYTPVEGDTWAQEPEFLFFSGGVNRPAIEETLKTFQEREGCQLTTVYNGCGILVAQMRAGARPDAYVACDVSFMRQVPDLFPQPVNLSQMNILIATPQSNPHGITSLQDLTKPGLKVGVGNPQQGALGALTQTMLADAGLLEGIMANVCSQTPTADLLVNQLRAGGLDAVIVYEANISQVREHVTTIPIQVAGASAIQPYAIWVGSHHKQLAQRLLQAITTPESQQKYKQAGFRWLYHEAGSDS